MPKLIYSGNFGSSRSKELANLDLGIFLLFHIGAVVTWMGSALLTSSVLTPAISRISTGTRREIMLNLVPKLIGYMLVSAVVTISAGILTLAYVGSMDQSMFPRQWSLISLLLGAFLGFSAAMITFASLQPVSNKLSKLLQKTENLTIADDDTSLEIEKAAESLKNGTRIVSVMLVIVVVMMVIGANSI